MKTKSFTVKKTMQVRTFRQIHNTIYKYVMIVEVFSEIIISCKQILLSLFLRFLLLHILPAVRGRLPLFCLIVLLNMLLPNNFNWVNHKVCLLMNHQTWHLSVITRSKLWSNCWKVFQSMLWGAYIRLDTNSVSNQQWYKMEQDVVNWKYRRRNNPYHQKWERLTKISGIAISETFYFKNYLYMYVELSSSGSTHWPPCA